ncbi:MAG TPA: hypothetical protein VFU41_09105 [Gemmatimonadales bacterium]|nr:hypothetical protein [Gemmatimonadales bacterium]
MSPAGGGWALGLLAGALFAAWSCAPGAAPPGGARATPAARLSDPRAAILVQRGCTECHAISAFGIRAARDVGPDLTFAYGDVVNRYGVSLETFLNDPSGVMRMMLASHLRLSAVDRDSMVHILKTLYEEHREQVDSGPPP